MSGTKRTVLRSRHHWQSTVRIGTTYPYPSPRIGTRAASSTPSFPINLHFIPPRDILVNAYIGTPPQKFRLLLDTGSSDLWVLSETLVPWEPGTKFHPLRSSTWQQSRAHWATTYVDKAVIEGIEGVEKVRIGDFEVDARVGVAESITTVDEHGRRKKRGKVEGIKAGTRGLPPIDGLLGVGLGSSFVDGLRGAGARGIKITFRVGEGGRNDLSILRDTDGEEGVVWYDVETDEREPRWEIVLKKILVDKTFSRVNWGQRMVVDTGSASHYLPSVTTELLFHQEPFSKKYIQIHFVPDQYTAVETTEAGYHLADPDIPDPPVRLVFRGPEVEWLLSLDSPTGDEYASLRSSAAGQPAVLGTPFLSQRKGVIFDFTAGKERIGFIGNDRTLSVEQKIGNRPRQRLVQFIVGASLGLGIGIGWKWYEGSLL